MTKNHFYTKDTAVYVSSHTFLISPSVWRDRTTFHILWWRHHPECNSKFMQVLVKWGLCETLYFTIEGQIKIIGSISYKIRIYPYIFIQFLLFVLNVLLLVRVFTITSNCKCCYFFHMYFRRIGRNNDICTRSRHQHTNHHCDMA